ncbi:hypothetical protein LCGC14_1209190 [marine sediment metagenome]|uniref:PBP domain-containing protein n=1 Tax=marine sediment metagenome TaxID=412755 RepID=A0A0F9LIX2_9ZZZZ
MKILNALIVLLVFSYSGISQAEVVVVANKNNEVKALTKKQVIDIYMGRTSFFPDGQAALPIDQKASSVVRKLFYNQLVNKTVSEINAYWARLIFSGRATPPRTLESVTTIIDFIKKNKSAIAYIQLEDVTDDVQVINYVD